MVEASGRAPVQASAPRHRRPRAATIRAVRSGSAIFATVCRRSRSRGTREAAATAVREFLSPVVLDQSDRRHRPVRRGVIFVPTRSSRETPRIRGAMASKDARRFRRTHSRRTDVQSTADAASRPNRTARRRSNACRVASRRSTTPGVPIPSHRTPALRTGPARCTRTDGAPLPAITRTRTSASSSASQAAASPAGTAGPGVSSATSSETTRSSGTGCGRAARPISPPTTTTTNRAATTSPPTTQAIPKSAS